MPKSKKTNSSTTTLANIPPDILNELSSYLPLNETSKLSKTTRQFFNLFNNESSNSKAFLKNLILKLSPFDIMGNMLDELENKTSPEEPLDYKKLYIGLALLAQNIERLPPMNYLTISAGYIQQIPLVLLCCANNNSLLDWIPKEDLSTALEISSYAGANTAIQEGMKRKLYPADTITLQIAAKSGNLTLTRHLLEDYALSPTQNILYDAARSGNALLVEHLFGLKYDGLNLAAQALKLDLITICYAVESGNLALAQMGTDMLGSPIFPEIHSVLSSAAASGNPALVQFLLNTLKNLDSQSVLPKMNTLHRAAARGDLDMVKYLLQFKNENNEQLLTPDETTLRNAAESGNLRLMEYLLDLSDVLKPNLDTLHAAAKSGSITLTKYLLNLKTVDEKPLMPESFTLTMAIHSGNLSLVTYLMSLKTKDEEALLPEQYMLNEAAYSGNVDLVKYLLTLQDMNGKALMHPTQYAINCAAEASHFEVVSFLSRYGRANDALLIPNSDRSDKEFHPKIENHRIPSALAINNARNLLKTPQDESNEKTVKNIFHDAYNASPIYFAEEIRYLAENTEQYPGGETTLKLAKELINELSRSSLPLAEKQLIEELDRDISTLSQDSSSTLILKR